MAVRWFQTFEETGEPYGTPGYDLTYKADGSETTSDIVAAAFLYVPATYRGMYVQSLKYEHKGAGFWEIKANYGVGDRTETFEGDTSGGTIHREFALSTISAYDADGPGLTTWFGNLIGVNGDKIDGVDVPDEAFQFTISKTWEAAFLATGYCASIIEMTGKVNDGEVNYTWLGQSFSFSAGELRFKGASMGEADPTELGDAQIRLVYKFEFSKNATNLTVGDITDIDKDGWDYLWCRTERVTVSGFTSMQPAQVMVERVSERVDFADLLIFAT